MAPVATVASKAAIPAMMGAMAAGTTMSIYGAREEGKAAQELANARAAIDIEQAKYARKRSKEEAGIHAEEGKRFLAKQKALYAASNVRTDVGAPLLIKAKAKSDIVRDIEYILEGGEFEALGYEQSAAYERAYGKSVKKQSRLSAWSKALQGYGSLAYLGYEGGLFSGSGTKYYNYPESSGRYPTATQGARW